MTGPADGGQPPAPRVGWAFLSAPRAEGECCGRCGSRMTHCELLGAQDRHGNAVDITCKFWLCTSCSAIEPAEGGEPRPASEVS